MRAKFLQSVRKQSRGMLRLYRGLEQTDAHVPNGYSTWTDNPALAREYAGTKGYVYQIDLPKSELGRDLVDENGERPLFLPSEKKVGLNGVEGNEYLVYTYHDNYNPSLIKLVEKSKVGFIRLYRGLEQPFDAKYDLSRTDAPSGYSTWTDNPALAREYAGANGYVYQIDLPESELGRALVGKKGERPLFIQSGKNAGLNGVSGNEYLVYTYHNDYDPSLVKPYAREDF
jgi:hypothetical protein